MDLIAELVITVNKILMLDLFGHLWFGCCCLLVDFFASRLGSLLVMQVTSCSVSFK